MEVKTVTSIERAAAIRAGLAVHLLRMPAGWQAWPAGREVDFLADLKAFHGARNVRQLLPAARRVASAYGLSLARIDPMHGQA